MTFHRIKLIDMKTIFNTFSWFLIIPILIIGPGITFSFASYNGNICFNSSSKEQCEKDHNCSCSHNNSNNCCSEHESSANHDHVNINSSVDNSQHKSFATCLCGIYQSSVPPVTHTRSGIQKGTEKFKDHFQPLTYQIEYSSSIPNYKKLRFHSHYISNLFPSSYVGKVCLRI